MNTRTLPSTIALHSGHGAALANALHWRWQHLKSAWAAYSARRAAEQAERELSALSPRTLQDIGAPEGLIGQRRWQDEQRQLDVDRLIERRGW